ncbi:MAG: hypothetical protein HQL41_00510 [Alphaproteobacteria bacterium]|nr:hypothetical protein [Alphaproteobacteria bacterium]
MSTSSQIYKFWERGIGAILLGDALVSALQIKNIELIAAVSRQYFNNDAGSSYYWHARRQKYVDAYYEMLTNRVAFISESTYRFFLSSALAEHRLAEVGHGFEVDRNAEVFHFLARAAAEVDEERGPRLKPNDVFRIGYAPASHVERDQGGEIAVIVHARFNGKEGFRPILFQGKRANKRCVDLKRQNSNGNQIDLLVKNGNGAYIVYNDYSYPPTVVDASVAKAALDAYGMWSLDPIGGNFLAFSIFMTFFMLYDNLKWNTYDSGEGALKAILGEKSPESFVYVSSGKNLSVERFLTHLKKDRKIDLARIVGNFSADELGSRPCTEATDKRDHRGQFFRDL